MAVDIGRLYCATASQFGKTTRVIALPRVEGELAVSPTPTGAAVINGIVAAPAQKTASTRRHSLSRRRSQLGPL